MGKATIISDSGAGGYTVQPVIDTATAATQITALQDANTAIDTRLGEIPAEITAAQSDIDFITTSLHAAITNGDDASHISDLQEELHTAEIALMRLTSERDMLKLKKASNEKRIDFLTTHSTQPAQQSAWCADYTEGLTGDVGTIETGRVDDTLIIVPGFTSAAHTSADGEMQPVSLATPAAAFYNYAMLPGANKWKPLYRTGTASNVDTDANTMSVTLDAVTIAGVSCDQGLSLSGVAVSYMDCNAEAFEDGDGVVVEFSGDFSTPTVIGFSAGPQECGCEELKLEGTDEPEVGSVYTATGGSVPLTFAFDSGTISTTDTTCTITAIDSCSVSESSRIGIITVTDSCSPTAQTASIDARLPGGKWKYRGVTFSTGESSILDDDQWWEDNHCLKPKDAVAQKVEYSDGTNDYAYRIIGGVKSLDGVSCLVDWSCAIDYKFCDYCGTATEHQDALDLLVANAPSPNFSKVGIAVPDGETITGFVPSETTEYCVKRFIQYYDWVCE